MAMFKARLAVLLALLLGAAAGVQASTDLPDTLVLGKVSHNPRKHYGYLKPMLDHVVGQLSDMGIRKGKVRMARSKHELSEWMRLGYVDWVTETAFATALFLEQADAVPLLHKWKKGTPAYRSVMFTRTDSDIRTLHDLRGRTLALEDAASTSAFYLAAFELRKAGLKVAYLPDIRTRPPQDTVGFVFARDEINISTLVHRGLADAGAFSNQDWEKSDHMPPDYRAAMRIFNTSGEIIRAVESVSSHMPPALRQRLQQLLLEADRSSQGRHALQKYQRTDRFEQLTAQQIQSIRALYPLSLALDRYMGL